MSSIFFIEFHCTPRGVKQEELLPVWLEEVDFYLKEREEKGKVKHIWKSVGECRMYIVIEGSGEDVDLMMLTTPLMVKHGQHTTVKVHQVLPYDVFAQNFTKLSPLPSGVLFDFGEKNRSVDENASHLWMEVEVGYQGKTREDLLRWEAEEIAAAMGAYKSGLIVEGWKSVATFPLTFYFVVRQESANSLDDIFFHLPLFVKNGENIKTKLTPIREGKHLAQKLRQMVSPN